MWALCQTCRHSSFFTIGGFDSGDSSNHFTFFRRKSRNCCKMIPKTWSSGRKFEWAYFFRCWKPQKITKQPLPKGSKKKVQWLCFQLISVNERDILTNSTSISLTSPGQNSRRCSRVVYRSIQLKAVTRFKILSLNIDRPTVWLEKSNLKIRDWESSFGCL